MSKEYQDIFDENMLTWLEWHHNSDAEAKREVDYFNMSATTQTIYDNLQVEYKAHIDYFDDKFDKTVQ